MVTMSEVVEELPFGTLIVEVLCDISGTVTRPSGGNHECS
jgi:hypothetical protein